MIVPHVMISGGGTGGHIMPAIAMCEFIHARYPQAVLWYVGRPGSMEERLMTHEHVRFTSLHAAPYRSGFAMLWFLTAQALGFLEGIFLIIKSRPDVIIGFGGYASAPLCLAGLFLRRNVVIHEANAVPGKAVKMLVACGARFACGLDSDNPALRHLRRKAEKKQVSCFTGNPLRTSFTEPITADDYAFTGLNTAQPVVMVLGGSQGARFLNLLVCNACAALKNAIPELQIIHCTGADDCQLVEKTYSICEIPHYVTSFSNRITALYAAADVVISRAGAMTVAEICAAGIPAVLVPYPFATELHQHENARILADKGGAVVVDQNQLGPDRIVEILSKLFADPAALKTMGQANRALAVPDAARLLWDFAYGEQELDHA